MIWKLYPDTQYLDLLLADKARQFEQSDHRPLVHERPAMQKDNVRPLVSIGIPVYNGEDHLAEALEAVLAQTFDDFEVIISDNGSFDRTPEIARAYARRDRRIIYHRSEQNRGAAWNFNLVFKRARGKYFKWLAHDDVLDPGYLQHCVAAMESYPEDVVLIFPRRRFIDSASRIVRKCTYQPQRAISENGCPFREIRFRELISLDNAFFPAIVFGLMRTKMLRQTRLIGGYIASDMVLLTEICLRGRVRQLQEYLCNQRVHRRDSWRANLNRKQEAAWFDPNQYRRVRAPNVRLFMELLKAVARSPHNYRRKMSYASQTLLFPTSRLYKRLRNVVWSSWSWISFQGLALARFTTWPVRIWAVARHVRRYGIRQTGFWSTFSLQNKTDLLTDLSQTALLRKQPRCYRLMIHWLNSSNEACRKAAHAALSVLEPEELEYINNYRSRLDKATAHQLTEFILYHVAENQGYTNSNRFSRSPHMPFDKREEF